MIKIIQGDITELKVDAIVNAANRTLLGGGGVDGAIHRKAGPQLLEECKNLRRKEYPDGLPIGKAVLTNAYDLPAKYVIHTVGPYFGRDDTRLLSDCFKNCLDVAEKNKLQSIAFPAISTGAYSVPIKTCAEFAKKVFDNYSFNNIKEVIMCLFSEEDNEVFKKVFSNK